jgi:hypothetical protein
VKTALLALGLAGMIGCLESCNPFAPDQSVQLGASKLDAPQTITSGSSLNVVVTVQLGGCLSFDRIVTERTTTNATLTVLGTDAAKGRKNVSCATYIFYEPHTVRLDPPFSNPFTITANNGRLPPLTATVQVQ